MSALEHAGYRLETVRLLEQSAALQIDEMVTEAEAAALDEERSGGVDNARPKGGLFQRLLQSRADWLSRMLGLQYHQELFEQQALRVLLLLATGFFLLGLFAASQAFDRAESTVNFYWLLVVLLGVNMLMLLFWVGVVLSRLFGASSPGRFMLYPVAIWLVQKAARFARHTADSAPDIRALPADPGASTYKQSKPLDSMLYGRFWTRLQTAGDCGFWNLSVLSHAVWCAYLLGGLMMTLILLSLRQYDFVWATTVLSAEAFVSMTGWLGAVPSALGLGVPDTALAYDSRLGAVQAADGSRILWSNLLLASLVLWGILPRLLLLISALLARGRALSGVSADLASPYYVGLRQRLLSRMQSGSIIDPDQHRASKAATPGHAGSQSQLPTDYAVAAIYPDPSLPCPPTSLSWQEDLGAIDDAASEATVLKACRRASSPNLLLCVYLSTVPDRGIRRLVKAVKNEFAGRLYLGLLLKRDAETSRLEDWYGLAAALEIPLDDLVQIPISVAAGETV